MKESRTLEYKETVSSSFLKTVSAFANYGTGEIKFGINDNGETVGINDPENTCLDIENRINDSISPVPDYTLNVDTVTSVITLRVSEGTHKPYLYKAKAYRRNDTATIEADRLELTRLILEGQNLSYESLASKRQELRFSVLEGKLKAVLNTGSINSDVLKTLELYTDTEGYNNAGALLADENDFCGIDIVRFGSSISILLDRETYDKCSILTQYDSAVRTFRKYYCYEQITGAVREKKERIPEAAFREAVANALVHRTWDIDAHINIAMFDDRIEITSPGSLPRGISYDEYLNGGISILRNRILGNIFLRLKLIERFGTGIRRINEEYAVSKIKPLFSVSDNAIKITLPVMQTKPELNEDEDILYSALSGKNLSSSALAELCGFGKSKTVSLLKKLCAEGYIRVTGTGRGTKYHI